MLLPEAGFGSRSFNCVLHESLAPLIRPLDKVARLAKLLASNDAEKLKESSSQCS
jgi:hypothetical protein